MKEWEIRMFHDRAHVDAQCEAIGFDIPEHPEGCVKTPKNLWRKFNGIKFYPAFEKLGHDFAEFSKCKCRKKIGEINR